MRLSLILSLFLLIGTGCGLLPTPIMTEEHAVRLPARSPDFREQTKIAMEVILLDPGSTTYQDWNGPKPGYKRGFWQRPKLVGWYWDVYINSRNRFGGYVGYELYRFLLDENNKLWWHRDPVTDGERLSALFGVDPYPLLPFVKNEEGVSIPAQPREVVKR